MSSLIAPTRQLDSRASDEATLESLAGTLRSLGLANLAAALLESGGAFAILAAQSLYLSEPLLGSFIPTASLQQLAAGLEDPDSLQALVSLLREPAA